ncbi:MAG: aminopeptidase P family protein [Alphaproteobacteria bacterium]
MVSVYAKRLQCLEEALRSKEWHGFCLAYADRFLNEFIPDSDKRLAWLSGFTGSAGLAFLNSKGKHALFVDGRYTLQARQEVDLPCFEVLPWTDAALLTWVQTTYGKGDVMGFDPWCHSFAGMDRYQKLLEPTGIVWDAAAVNPIDSLWEDRPPPPQQAFRIHPEVFAGKTSSAKRQEIVDSNPQVDAWLLASNASIAWLLNVRGADLPCTPVNRCYGVLYKDTSVDLFLPSQDQVSPELLERLQPCRLYPLEALAEQLAAVFTSQSVVGYDPAYTPFGWVDLCEKLSSSPKLRAMPDPCLLPKACKNEGELKQIAQAYEWDGMAWICWRHWLETLADTAQETELSVAEKLHTFRQQQPYYEGPSFETIAGHGPHGAIVHYRAIPKTARALTQNHLLLVDAGGQYTNGGTTDTTRTLALGLPTLAQKEHYTQVLKGHISLASLVFPHQTTGAQIDGFARRALWEAGCDYDHGTGHGVGSFLSVHEGPQGISSRATTPFVPGMLISNEPGYYEEGAYGIRLESVVQVALHTLPNRLCFKTLTLVPFEPNLVEVSLLTKEEQSWLAAYHQRIVDTLAHRLPLDVQAWLPGFVAPFLAME